MSMPKKTEQRMRGMAVAATAPLWTVADTTRRGGHRLLAWLRFLSKEGDGPPSQIKEERDRLALENLRLQTQIALLKEQLQQEWTVQSGLVKLQQLSQSVYDGNSFFHRRQEELALLLDYQLDGYPARVIFRDPSSWSSSLWVNVGQIDNQHLGRIAVAKNSPVVVGLNVVGVIDYVGYRQSRVRLITDAGLTPSVRAARGFSHDLILRDRLVQLAHLLALPIETTGSTLDSHLLQQQLLALLQKLPPALIGSYLAKGEVHGSSLPLWRSRADLLKGTGFNLDFADKEGPARDLRSGMPVEGGKNAAALPLLQPHDLLVTTGMDGIFPPGLHVAEIAKVEQLKEGGYAYELSARPTVGKLDDLSVVFVLPPVGFNDEDYPQK